MSGEVERGFAKAAERAHSQERHVAAAVAGLDIGQHMAADRQAVDDEDVDGRRRAIGHRHSRRSVRRGFTAGDQPSRQGG